MSMSLITVATISANSEFETRAQVVDAIDKIVSLVDSVTSTLDMQQEYFENLDIDNQYFSMLQSYYKIMALMSQALKLLVATSFNLKTEKRFTLDRDRSPIEITITEYGSFGENDENLDLFIRSNSLHGDQIELIPAGTEVVIYVG